MEKKIGKRKQQSNLYHQLINTKRVEVIAITCFLLGIVLICVGFVLILRHAGELEQRCWSSNERQLGCKIQS